MANVKLIFQGTEKSNTEKSELQIYANSYNELTLGFNKQNEYPLFISLDKITAVRLVRELKKQIGYLDMEGGQNGNR